MTRYLDALMIKSGFEAADICSLKYRKFLYAANIVGIGFMITTTSLAVSSFI